MANDLRKPSIYRPRGAVGPTAPDIQRLANAISGPGIDTNRWIASGTVGVIDDDGNFSTTDPEAVYVDELGAVVDVRIEPSGEAVPARYNGIAVGRFGSMLIPLRGGDEVLVVIPDGDLNHPGVAIVGFQSNETAKIPTNWNNDRVLFQLAVPFEINGPAVRINSANLVLNGRPVVRSPEGI